MTPPAPKSTSKRSSAARNGAGTKAATPKRAAKGGSRPSDKLTREQLLAFYRSMYQVRVFEEQVIALFQEGVLPGFLHVAIGQEGVATGVSEALDPGDFVGSTHRAHGHVLARGSSSAGMMAELMGRITGYCRGKGGSMHVSDMSHNVVGANGVVGAGAPMMNGVALSQQTLGTGKIAVAYYGDGASNQGNVHEAMNLAQLWKLPTLFVLENNRYAESTPLAQHSPIEDLTLRGRAFDMKTLTADGNDVLAVYDVAVEAAEYARSGKGPVYLVFELKRLPGHYVGDAEVYRPKGEAKEWKAADPIPRFAKELEGRGVKPAELATIRGDVEAEIEDAVAKARAADFPAAEEAMEHVYAEFPYEGPVIGV
jgi:acetoin:2,6-dichlorophenolindophenol oxidoreductase subunit alpha